MEPAEGGEHKFMPKVILDTKDFCITIVVFVSRT